MPYTIHTAKAKIKDPLGNFRSIDVFSNEIEDTQLAAIQAVNDAKTAAIHDIEDRTNAEISSYVTNDEVEAMLVPIFDTATAYSAGTYVRNADGSINKLYYLTANHAAGTAWADTSKVAVTIGNQVTDLRKALGHSGIYGTTNLLFPLNQPAEQTIRGITYNWNDDKTILTVSGHISEGYANYSYLVFNKLPLPAGLEAGKTYHVKYSSVNVPLYIYSHNASRSAVKIFTSKTSGDFTIPNDTELLDVRFYFGPNIQFNEQIEVPIVYNDYANIKLLNDINKNQHNLPEYYFANNYIENKIANIRDIAATIGEGGFQSIFVTDAHWELSAQISQNIVKYIMENTGIKTFVFGGDAITYDYTSKSAGYKLLCDFLRDYSILNGLCNAYYVTGNHEFNNADGSHATSELSRGTIKRLLNEPIHFKIHSLDGMNTFYVDDDVSKIRFYFVESKNDGNWPDAAERRKIEQTLLDVPDGYSVFVYAHYGVTKQGEIISRVNEFNSICKLMNDGDGPETINGVEYDFTNKQHDYIGMISGHNHVDQYAYYDGRFPVISTTCDAYNTTLGNEQGRTAGTINEHAIDVIQVDTTAKRIYLTRIGYGNDRVFSYGEAGSGLVN